LALTSSATRTNLRPWQRIPACWVPPLLTSPTVQDTDDLYYSAEKRRVFVLGRGGSIWVYQQADPDHYNLISQILTVVGAGTAGYFGRQGKGFDRFYLAVSASSTASTEVRVYAVQD
jgi:hypothetical protein